MDGAASLHSPSSDDSAPGTSNMTSEPTSSGVNTAAMDRAARRRRKILEQGEDRMRKIITGDRTKSTSPTPESSAPQSPCDDIGLATSSVDTQNEKLTPSAMESIDSRLTPERVTPDRLAPGEPDNELRYRGPEIGQARTPSPRPQTLPTNPVKPGCTGTHDSGPPSFPEKVTKVSTPINFRTLLKSQEDNPRMTLGLSILLLIQDNISGLASGLFLLLIASLSSFFNIGFALPFIGTQSFRLAISNNHDPWNTMMDLKFLGDTFTHLAFFTFFYIMTSVIFLLP